MIFYIQKSVRFCPRVSRDTGNDFSYIGQLISGLCLGLHFLQGFCLSSSDSPIGFSLVILDIINYARSALFIFIYFNLIK